MRKYFDLSRIELDETGKVEFNDPNLEELNREQMELVTVGIGGTADDNDISIVIVIPVPNNNWTWLCDGNSPANVDCTNYTGCSEEQNAGECSNRVYCSDGNNYGSKCTNSNWCDNTSDANCKK